MMLGNEEIEELTQLEHIFSAIFLFNLGYILFLFITGFFQWWFKAGCFAVPLVLVLYVLVVLDKKKSQIRANYI